MRLKEQLKQKRFGEMYCHGRINEIDFNRRISCSREQSDLILNKIKRLEENMNEKPECSPIITAEMKLNMVTGKFEHTKASIRKEILHQVIRSIIVRKKEDIQEVEVQLIDGNSFMIFL